LPLDVTVELDPEAGDTDATEPFRVVHEIVTLLSTLPLVPCTCPVSAVV
jgi:hypothetical protein